MSDTDEVIDIALKIQEAGIRQTMELASKLADAQWKLSQVRQFLEDDVINGWRWGDSRAALTLARIILEKIGDDS